MRLRVIALSLVAMLLAGCGQGAQTGAAAVPASTSAAPGTTASPTTTIAATTTVATTTSIATTTTTSLVLPVPMPPPDPKMKEPIVELGSLEIPSLGVVKPMLEGVSLSVLDHGPGHWPGTAMPGHLGNVVIGGHRTSKDRPFRHIDQLVPGDEVILTTLEGRFVYKVTETQVVTPDSLWIIEQQREYTATLFACHPAGSTKQRIIVFLELADPATAV